MKRFIDDLDSGLRINAADKELNERLYLATFTASIAACAFYYIGNGFNFGFNYQTFLIVSFLVVNFCRFILLSWERQYSVVGHPRTRIPINLMSATTGIIVGALAHSNMTADNILSFVDVATMLTLASYAALSTMTFASKQWLAAAQISFVLGMPAYGLFQTGYSEMHIIAVLLCIYSAALILHSRLLHLQFIKFEQLAEKAREAAVAKASNEQLNMFFQETPFPMHIMDADGTLRMANHAWSDLWSFGHEKTVSLFGKVNLLRDLGTDQHNSFSNLARVLRGEKVVVIEAAEIDPSRIVGFGRARWVERYYNPVIDRTGTVTSVLVMYNDVTDRRKAEMQALKWQDERGQALIREQTATEASKMKTEFLANMSHEIRTPINGVLGMIGFLRDSKLDFEQREYAEAAHRSANGLLTVINDILDLSKVEAGKLELESRDFSMSEIVGDVAHVFSILSEQKNLKFNVHVDDTLKTPLFGDANRIRQILNNLVSNAVKFTERGSIDVSVNLIEERMFATDDTVKLRLSVRDTGLGIPLAMQSRMFKAFEQANSSTSRKFGGTGLGLAISKNLAELMHGSITFTSEEGTGSEFSVILKLPRGKGVITEVASFAGDMSVFTGGRVLIAEDNKINQVITKKVLESLGLVCEVAENGHEVLSLLERASFDLILMDCQMPSMDGFEATVKIRSLAETPYASMPIIGFTAGAMQADRDRCLESGMNDYLSKPADKTALVKKLGPILERKLAAHAS